MLRTLAVVGMLAAGVSAQSEQALEMGALRSAFVNEDSFQYYSVVIPPSSNAIKVKLIPSYGDPDVYLSFRSAEPDDLTATWVMDDVGAEEQVIKRDAEEFCQFEPCILHMSVYGYDESEYMIGVYDASVATLKIEDECAPGCKQDQIADGICQQACRTSACSWDGLDCGAECYMDPHGRDYVGYVNISERGATCEPWPRTGTRHNTVKVPRGSKHCTPGRKTNYVKDRVASNFCRNEDGSHKAPWCYVRGRREYCNVGNPGQHCTRLRPSVHRETNAESGLLESTPPSECFSNIRGSDYRGTMNRTRSGHSCQRWDVQTPHQHDRQQATFPYAGLGPHNHCRNPGDLASPWCFTTDSHVRWEPCDVGRPWESCSPGELPSGSLVRGPAACVTEDEPESGFLVNLERSCGDGATREDVCGSKCCDAANAARVACATVHRKRYEKAHARVASAMLQHECSTCPMFADLMEEVRRVNGLVRSHSTVRGVWICMALLAVVGITMALCIYHPGVRRFHQAAESLRLLQWMLLPQAGDNASQLELQAPPPAAVDSDSEKEDSASCVPRME